MWEQVYPVQPRPRPHSRYPSPRPLPHLYAPCWHGRPIISQIYLQVCSSLLLPPLIPFPNANGRRCWLPTPQYHGPETPRMQGGLPPVAHRWRAICTHVTWTLRTALWCVVFVPFLGATSEERGCWWCHCSVTMPASRAPAGGAVCPLLGSVTLTASLRATRLFVNGTAGQFLPRAPPFLLGAGRSNGILPVSREAPG